MGEKSVHTLAELLHEPGEPFEFGIEESDSEKYTKLAAQYFSEKPCCVVRDWVIWDVVVAEKEAEAYKVNGFLPIILHAKFVIFDQSGRANHGDFRMSTLLTTLRDPCFFVTKNTVYILTGEGTRKSAEQNAVLAFYY